MILHFVPFKYRETPTAAPSPYYIWVSSTPACPDAPVVSAQLAYLSPQSRRRGRPHRGLHRPTTYS